VDAAFALETASYPADEAASLDSLQFRQAHAGEYFYGAFDGSEALRGFVCATVAPGDELTQETMAEHHPDGSTLCIHSVVVASDLRRKGVATAMLREYCKAVALGNPRLARIALIAKANLLRLYVKAGFTVNGMSPVVHGRDPWFDLTAECQDFAGEEMLQADAFIVDDKPYSGNPAAVVFTHRDGDATWMQNVALENNLSETSFLERAAEGVYDLRWFTPAVEVSLCGHATLAAAHALWDTKREAGDTIVFKTQSGELTARRFGQHIELDFPTEEAEQAATDEERDHLHRGLRLREGDL